MDLLPFSAHESNKEGMVGYIAPFGPFLKKKADALVVVDDNPALETGIMDAGHTVIIDAGHTVSRDIRVLKDADIVIITGSMGAVGGLDVALDAAESARFIGVVGPSAG